MKGKCMLCGTENKLIKCRGIALCARCTAVIYDSLAGSIGKMKQAEAEKERAQAQNDQKAESD